MVGRNEIAVLVIPDRPKLVGSVPGVDVGKDEARMQVAPSKSREVPTQPSCRQ